MIDEKTLTRIPLLHPKLREEALSIYLEITSALTGNVGCRFSCTLRTFAEQDELYSLGRSKVGNIVTNAKGGFSYHNYGLALDIVLLVDKDRNGTYESAVWDTKGDFDGDRKSDWIEIVNIFKQHGWEWGGDWKFTDTPHFQKTYGHSVRELLYMYNSAKVDKNNYVLI